MEWEKWWEFWKREAEQEEIKEINKVDSDLSVAADDKGVYIGSIKLDKIDARWWRSNVGLVSQEPFLFNDTILNNVSNGLSGTKWDKLEREEKLEMVQNACKEAGPQANKKPHSSIPNSSSKSHPEALPRKEDGQAEQERVAQDDSSYKSRTHRKSSSSKKSATSSVASARSGVQKQGEDDRSSVRCTLLPSLNGAAEAVV